MALQGGRNVRTSELADSISLVDTLFEAIRERILTWEYVPNDLLGEKMIADEFGVSRTPVREALALLSQEGLLEIIPRVGYRVSSFSIRDVHEIFDMRLLLEGEAATRAARLATECDWVRLQSTHHEWANALTQHSISAIDYLKYHDAFHMGIAELAGSQRLARFIGQLLREGTRLRMSDPLMSNLGLESEQKECTQLIDALMQGDADQACELQQKHIAESKQRILRWLIEQGGTQGISVG